MARWCLKEGHYITVLFDQVSACSDTCKIIMYIVDESQLGGLCNLLTGTTKATSSPTLCVPKPPKKRYLEENYLDTGQVLCGCCLLCNTAAYKPMRYKGNFLDNKVDMCSVPILLSFREF